MNTPTGGMAKMNFEVIRRAELLQALANQFIDVEYAVDRKVTDIQQLTYESFLADYQQAKSKGEENEFNSRYAALLMPIVEQVLQQQQGAQ